MHPCNIPFHTNQPETLLTRKQVEELLDVSRATIYRWLRSNTAFPKQIRLNPHKKRRFRVRSGYAVEYGTFPTL